VGPMLCSLGLSPRGPAASGWLATNITTIGHKAVESNTGGNRTAALGRPCSHKDSRAPDLHLSCAVDLLLQTVSSEHPLRRNCCPECLAAAASVPVTDRTGKGLVRLLRHPRLPTGPRIVPTAPPQAYQATKEGVHTLRLAQQVQRTRRHIRGTSLLSTSHSRVYSPAVSYLVTHQGSRKTMRARSTQGCAASCANGRSSGDGMKIAATTISTERTET